MELHTFQTELMIDVEGRNESDDKINFVLIKRRLWSSKFVEYYIGGVTLLVKEQSARYTVVKVAKKEMIHKRCFWFSLNYVVHTECARFQQKSKEVS
jgi:hypothetical protein